MSAAISRRYHLDQNEPSWCPEQKISIQQAIDAYTKDAAYASFEESIKGTLEPGKLADFIILSNDLRKSANPENCLRDLNIVATILDGTIAYHNEKYDI